MPNRAGGGTPIDVPTRNPSRDDPAHPTRNAGFDSRRLGGVTTRLHHDDKDENDHDRRRRRARNNDDDDDNHHEDEHLARRMVFMANVPAISQDVILRELRQFGYVERFRRIDSRNIAFVTYAQESQARDAIRDLDGVMLRGKTLRLLPYKGHLNGKHHENENRGKSSKSRRESSRSRSRSPSRNRSRSESHTRRDASPTRAKSPVKSAQKASPKQTSKPVPATQQPTASKPVPATQQPTASKPVPATQQSTTSKPASTPAAATSSSNQTKSSQKAAVPLKSEHVTAARPVSSPTQRASPHKKWTNPNKRDASTQEQPPLSHSSPSTPKKPRITPPSSSTDMDVDNAAP
ncbi:hypothetical protein BC940DRAFT_297371, partial [Gongronella butleri]